MRSYDGAEICEPIRIYSLNRLLLLIKVVLEEGLSIIIETNVIGADFLDVTFIIATEKQFTSKG